VNGRDVDENEDDPFAHLRAHAKAQEDAAQQWNAWYAEYNKFIQEEKERKSQKPPEPEVQEVKQKAPEIKKEFEDRATFVLKTGIQKEMTRMLEKPLNERKKALRTLQLQWHPDKNPDKVEITKCIFQFIEESKDWFLA